VTCKESIWAQLWGLTPIILVVGLVVGVSTWMVAARLKHPEASQSIGRWGMVARTSHGLGTPTFWQR
jgi:hypothetical protein